jgi:hypothetical protein
MARHPGEPDGPWHSVVWTFSHLIYAQCNALKSRTCQSVRNSRISHNWQPEVQRAQESGERERKGGITSKCLPVQQGSLAGLIGPLVASTDQRGVLRQCGRCCRLRRFAQTAQSHLSRFGSAHTHGPGLLGLGRVLPADGACSSPMCLEAALCASSSLEQFMPLVSFKTTAFKLHSEDGHS